MEEEDKHAQVRWLYVNGLEAIWERSHLPTRMSRQRVLKRLRSWEPLVWELWQDCGGESGGA